MGKWIADAEGRFSAPANAESGYAVRMTYSADGDGQEHAREMADQLAFGAGFAPEGRTLITHPVLWDEQDRVYHRTVWYFTRRDIEVGDMTPDGWEA